MRRDVLLGPRSLEVEHRRLPAQASKQARGGCVEREVGVDNLNAGRRTARGHPIAQHAARQRQVMSGRRLDPRGSLLGGSDHNAHRLRELLEKGAVVTIEAADR